MKKQAYIIDGIRTAIGNFGGTLSTVRADDLAAHAIKGLMDRHSNLDFSKIEDVILGCANQAGEDNRNVARMAKFLASGLEQRKCISLECGLQNGTLAVFVATQLFDDIVFMVPTAAYALIMFVTSIIFVLIVRKIN